MRQNLKYFLIITFVGILAWYQTLGFWFFKGYEATWLLGVTPHNIVNLIKGHGIIYFIDWKLFGWNPLGWYATSLTFHISASLLLFYFIYLISKNKLLSFISAIFFVASSSYNDVLTWGSFNSYYPLLLIWILSSLITFIKYKETKKLYLLILSGVFAVLGFFTRETGIIIIPILTVFDIVFSKNLKNRKTINEIIKRQIFFYLALITFFIIRGFYGGTPGDTADSNVKLQMRFVSDGLYFEYAKAALLTFGKLIPPQIIPYPFLNYVREYLSRFLYFEFMNIYSFPILGWVIFAIFGAVWAKIRKSKEYSRIFLFFLIWLGAFSLFVSLAIPNTPEVLARAYEYNTMRYRYFAFAGTSVLLALILLYFLYHKRKLLLLIIAGAVFANLLIIWRIEERAYVTSYKPAKEFYKKFVKFFPDLPKDAVFYLYPHAPGLSDYLLEWYLIKDDKNYHNLIGQPFRVESQIIAVLDKVGKGKVDLENVFFLDYESKVGLVNKTQEVRRLLKNQKEYQVSLNQNKDNTFESNMFSGPLVEIPYDLEINLTATLKEGFIGENPDSAKFRALVDYSLEKNKYLDSVTFKTAYTMSQRAGEPFFHVLVENLTDANTGPRSSWIADTFTPWVEVDLGAETEIIAVAWGSKEGSTRVPATYTILVSKDGRTWEKAKSVRNFNHSKSIDVFDKPWVVRYVRMEIKTTSGGDFVLLDEFEVINAQSQKILSYYTDRDQLLNDTYNLFKFAQGSEDLNYASSRGLGVYFAKASWETNKTTSSQNSQYLYFPYRIDQPQKISIKLPEGEVYAGTGQFLKKRITSLSLEFGNIPFIINVNSARLVPRINLK